MALSARRRAFGASARLGIVILILRLTPSSPLDCFAYRPHRGRRRHSVRWSTTLDSLDGDHNRRPSSSGAVFLAMAPSSDPADSSSRAVSPVSGMLLVSLREHVGSEEGQIRLILASQSPRRREILSMMGLEGRFEAIPSPLDEAALQAALTDESETDPIEYTRTLAEEKAKALADHLRTEPTRAESPIIVLGSDTIVALDGRILEKPRDADDARQMLALLSGRVHAVHTGVAIVQLPIGTVTSFVDTATVEFGVLTAEDVDAYVATGEPLDKAGSYGIQGIGGQLVHSVTGDFFTVMGLPMSRVSRALAAVVRDMVGQ